MAKRKTVKGKGESAEAPEKIVKIGTAVAGNLTRAWRNYFSDSDKSAELQGAIKRALKGIELKSGDPLPDSFLDKSVRPLITAQCKENGLTGDSLRTTVIAHIKCARWSHALLSIPQADYNAITADRHYLLKYLTQRNDGLPHAKALSVARKSFLGTARGARSSGGKKGKGAVEGARKSLATHSKSSLTLDCGVKFSKDAVVDMREAHALMYALYTGMHITLGEKYERFANTKLARDAVRKLGLN